MATFPLEIVNPLLPVISPVEVNVPAPVRAVPFVDNAVTPLGAKIIFPVERDPSVNV